MTEVIKQDIAEKLADLFLNYAMYVIIDRALPDIRDGLKPVQRRVLYSMHNLGLHHNKSFKKSARVVGDCFVKGTMVSTPNGLIAIENLKIGDKVYTQDSVEEVTEVYIMPKQKLLKVTLDNGFTNICTPGQKFKVFTPELTYEWKTADEFKEEDYLTCVLTTSEIDATKSKISFVKIKSIEDYEEEVTYDIQVSNKHEFIANGMVVHNCLGMLHPHGK